MLKRVLVCTARLDHGKKTTGARPSCRAQGALHQGARVRTALRPGQGRLLQNLGQARAAGRELSRPDGCRFRVLDRCAAEDHGLAARQGVQVRVPHGAVDEERLAGIEQGLARPTRPG